MENTANWRTESRTVYSNDFKLRIVELASQPDANVAKIARENGVAHNLIFKWLRMWQNEGRVSRRLPATITPPSELSLLPVEIVSEPPTSDNGSGQCPLNASSCSVEFRHVDFSYEPDTELIQDLNLHVEKGQHIAIVGPTGAGKTTITNLINRFYDIADGQILYDGIDVSKIKKADLRRSLGIVLQDTHLFTGTVIPKEANDSFGILLKSDWEASGCLFLEFDVAMQRVSLLSLPMGVDPFWEQSCQAVPKATEPGPDGVRVAEKTFEIKDGQAIDVKISVDHDMVEVFVGEQVAFTYRIFRKPEYELGLLAQDAKVEFANIAIRK